MSSSGKMRVKLTWIGVGNGPSMARMVVSASASALLSGPAGGTSDASDGLGDPAKDDEETPGWQWKTSQGNQLRAVTLTNKVRYLDLSKSASAGNSGRYAGAYATASGASGKFDPRTLNITLIDGKSQWTKPGARTSKSKQYSKPFPGVTITDTYSYDEAAVVPCEIVYDSISTNNMEVFMGLSKVQRGPTYDLPGVRRPIGLEAFSYFPYVSQYNRHGSYNWTLPHHYDYDLPSAGEFPADVTVYSNPTFSIFSPVDRVDATTRVFIGEDKNSAGTSDTVVFNVSWADGVSGQSKRTINWKSRAEKVAVSPQKVFQDSRLPIVDIPVRTADSMGDGWIDGSKGSANFGATASADLLKEIESTQYYLKLGERALTVLLPEEGLIAQGLSSFLSGLDFLTDFIHDDTFEHGKDGDEYWIGNTVPKSEYEAHKDMYDWKLKARPSVIARYSTIDQYNDTGFVGTTAKADDMMEPVKYAIKILVVRQHTFAMP